MVIRDDIFSQWLSSRIPVTKLTVKLGLAAVCAYVGALLAFPGLRLAQTHLDAVKMNAERPLIQSEPIGFYLKRPSSLKQHV